MILTTAALALAAAAARCSEGQKGPLALLFVTLPLLVFF